MGHFGWSAEFVDMDNDGYLDIFVNNGHGMADFDNPQTTVGQRNQIFRNNSDGTFSDISDQAGEAMKALGSGRGAAVGDFDNDGDLDLFVVNNNGPAQYLRNQNETSHHWILISLKGVKSNADGVGARVILKSGNTRQIREARHGSGYLSQMDPRIHFGLGAMARVDELEVVWPSGIRQKFKDLAGDQWITITEGQSVITVEARRLSLNQHEGPPHENEREDLLPEDRRFRLEIIKAWGRIPGQESRSFLVDLLREKDAEVRRTTVEALGDLGDPFAVEALTGLFQNDTRTEVRRAIARALKNFPASPEGLGVLLDGMSEADAVIRQEAGHSLSEFFAREERIFRGSMLKKREVVTALLKAAGDAEPNVRKWSARALGLSESYRAVIPVRDLFKDADSEVRLEAVRAAGRLRDKRAMQELFRVLDDDRETLAVRAEAILSLQRLGSDSVFESMRQKVSQGSREDRVTVLKMLRLLLESGEAVLVEESEILSLLNLMPAGADAEMMRHRIQVAALLPRTGITGETIRQGMESGDPALRREAVMAGLKIGQPDVLARLKDFLRGPDAEIRQQALRALGQETSPSRRDPWIPVVEEMARHDEIQAVRRAAMSVLLKLDAEKGVPWIAERVDKADGITKKVFMEILGESPREGAVDLLLAGLADGDVEVQTQAVHSLCPPDPASQAGGRQAGESAVNNKAFLVFLKKLPDKQTPLPVRQEILSCLRQRTRADMAVVSLLREILGDPRDPLRLDVLRSLPHWKELNTADTLRKMIQETD